MSETCLVTITQRVATITLNRPHKFNAFNLESYQATTDALRDADANLSLIHI